MVDDERDGQLDQRETGLVGERAQRVGGLELALVGRERQVEAGGQALARLGLGGSAPLR